MTKQRFFFTGEELAKAHLWHLTRDERDEYRRKNKERTRVHSKGFFSALGRRIGLGRRKIYLVRFKDGHGFIIRADNKESACIQGVPFLDMPGHGCREPRYNESCEECRTQFDELAEIFNHATVTWLGWGQPDFNWVIPF